MNEHQPQQYRKSVDIPAKLLTKSALQRRHNWANWDEGKEAIQRTAPAAQLLNKSGKPYRDYYDAEQVWQTLQVLREEKEQRLQEYHEALLQEQLKQLDQGERIKVLKGGLWADWWATKTMMRKRYGIKIVNSLIHELEPIGKYQTSHSYNFRNQLTLHDLYDVRQFEQLMQEDIFQRPENETFNE